MTRVYLSLGSNMGDRQDYLQNLRQRLKQYLPIMRRLLGD